MNVRSPAPAARPLDGIRVLELGQLIAGPFCTRLFAAMGRDDLLADASLAHNDGRAARQVWLDAEIEAWTRTRSPADILAAMEAAEVPASKIYSIADIVADPHYAAREMIRTIALADGKSLKVPGIVPRLSATPGDFDAGGPALGEHTNRVVGALGYDAAALAGLRARGVIG